MRVYNFLNPYLKDIFIDASGTIYYIYVRNNWLHIQTSPSGHCLYHQPFDNCHEPHLFKHQQLLLLAFIAKSDENCYIFRLIAPFAPYIDFINDLKYTHKPSYSINVLEDEIFLTIMCCKKLRICHIAFHSDQHCYQLRKLPFAI